jgi:hypothetical protein
MELAAQAAFLGRKAHTVAHGYLIYVKISESSQKA